MLLLFGMGLATRVHIRCDKGFVFHLTHCVLLLGIGRCGRNISLIERIDGKEVCDKELNCVTFIYDCMSWEL